MGVGASLACNAVAHSFPEAERPNQLVFTIGSYDRRMNPARIQRFVLSCRARVCLAGVALLLVMPFIAVHFRCDGLEDEPMLRLHVVGDAVQYEADDRADHPSDHETTVFSQLPASLDHPDFFADALGAFMALVLAMLPLAIALARLSAPIVREAPERVPPLGGAPPPGPCPTAPWQRLPPTAAPPFFA